MKNILNVLRWLIMLVLVCGMAFLVYAGVKITRPLKTSATEKTFTVKPGSTTEAVAMDLEAEELIGRAIFFKLYIYFKKSGHKIQAGDYLLSSAMSVREIALKLLGGEVMENEAKFTVIEGWTMSDIGEALESSGLSNSRDFSRVDPSGLADEFDFLKEIPRTYYTLEGYLFPDTYLLAKGETVEDIARKMVLNFDEKLTPELRETISQQAKTIRPIVILASIIEREVGRNVKKGTKLGDLELAKLRQERRLVASVFYNRLNLGKPLESDATISYITGRRGSSRATLEETRINSPYNTYRYVGLPPGPISNPSLDSIMAAIQPADSDYLFFITASDGTAYFAKTLEEHIQNRAKYLE